MAIPSITQFTTPVAQRTDPEGVFAERADIMVGEWVVVVDDMNAAIDEINDVADIIDASETATIAAKDAAVASANYKGEWSDLTGALNTPASVSHNSDIWLLQGNLADVTLSEPTDVNPDWEPLDYVNSAELTALESRTITAGNGLTGGGDLSASRTLTVGAGNGISVAASSVAVDIATASNVRAGTVNKILDAKSIYDAAAFVTLTDAATIAVDFNAGRNFQVTLTANRTMGLPSNLKAGQTGVIVVTQDAGGGNTLSYASGWDFPNGSVGIATGGNDVSVIGYIVNAAGTGVIATITADFV